MLPSFVLPVAGITITLVSPYVAVPVRLLQSQNSLGIWARLCCHVMDHQRHYCCIKCRRWDKFNVCSCDLFPDIVIFPTWTFPVASKFVVRAVPFTSNGYCGVAVFIPTLLLLTSMYNRFVSKAKF